MTALLRAERRDWHYHGPALAYGLLPLQTLTPRCGCWRVNPRSMSIELPLSVSHLVVKWLIWRHLSRFDPRSIPDKADLPRMSPSIPPGSMARLPNAGPTPGLRC